MARKRKEIVDKFTKELAEILEQKDVGPSADSRTEPNTDQPRRPEDVGVSEKRHSQSVKQTVGLMQRLRSGDFSRSQPLAAGTQPQSPDEPDDDDAEHNAPAIQLQSLDSRTTLATQGFSILSPPVLPGRPKSTRGRQRMSRKARPVRAKSAPAAQTRRNWVGQLLGRLAQNGDLSCPLDSSLLFCQPPKNATWIGFQGRGLHQRVARGPYPRKQMENTSHLTWHRLEEQ